MHESSILVQHQDYSGIVHAGGIRNVEITKSMVINLSISHPHYKDDLEKKKEMSKEE